LGESPRNTGNFSSTFGALFAGAALAGAFVFACTLGVAFGERLATLVATFLGFVGAAFLAFVAVTLLLVFDFAAGFDLVAVFAPLLFALLDAARETGWRLVVDAGLVAFELFVMVLQREPGWER
jgi:hypothetical protein